MFSKTKYTRILDKSADVGAATRNCNPLNCRVRLKGQHMDKNGTEPQEFNESFRPTESLPEVTTDRISSIHGHASQPNSRAANTQHQQNPLGTGQPRVAPPKQRKTRVVVLVAVLVVALLSALAGAAVALRKIGAKTTAPEIESPRTNSAPETGGLRITFKSAEARFYKFEYAMEGTVLGGGELADHSGPVSVKSIITSDMTLRVIERLSDGATQIKIDLSNTRIGVSVNGRPVQNPQLGRDNFETVLRVNPDGSFEIESGQGSPVFIPGPALGGGQVLGGGVISPFGFTGPAPLLPDHAIRPGEQWTKSIQIRPKGFSRPLQMTTVNTYEHDEKTEWGRAMLITSQSLTSVDLATLDLSRVGLPNGVRSSGTMTLNTFTRFWFVPDLGEPIKIVVDPSSSIKGSLRFAEASSGPQTSQSLQLEMDIAFGVQIERQSGEPPLGNGATNAPAVSS